MAAWQTPVAPPASPPPASRVFGTAPAAGWPSPYAGGQPGARRPGAVTVAAWLTLGFSAATGMLLLLVLVTLLAEKGQLVSALQKNPQIAQQGYSGAELLSALWVIVAVGLFWTLAAIALAVLALNRVRAGQVGLLVSSLLAGVLGLATVVVPLAAAVTVALLLRSDANRWFAGRETPSSRGPSDRPPPW